MPWSHEHVGYWAVVRSTLLVASIVVLGSRFLRAGKAVFSGKERWTQLLFPGIVAVELIRVLLGSTTRAATVVTFVALELILLAICGLAFWYFSPDRSLPGEQRLYRSARIFFPPHVSSLVTQEMVTVVSAFLLLKRAVSENESAGRSFGYVKLSPIRFLPLIILVGSVPELMLTHFALASHPLIKAFLAAGVVWSVLWALGTYVIMRERPHVLAGEVLTARMGVRRWCRIPLSTIKTVRLLDPYTAVPDLKEGGRFFIKHCDRLELTLGEPVHVHALDESCKTVSKVWITADDMQAMQAALSGRRTV